MKLGTFRGGIHPYEGKDLSKDLPIKELQPQGELVFPMVQHIGAPSKPIVAKGDKVLVGERIAKAAGPISANVYSSVSGTVKGIELRFLPNGNRVNSIIIENDGEYNTVEGFGKKREYTSMTPEEIRTIIQEAGIVGLGGAGFPTHVKLTPKDDSKIEYVIINGAECEPYLTSDYRNMLDVPNKVVEGLKIILKLFPNAKGVIGIEDNKPEAVKSIQAIVEQEPRIEVRVLETKYPQGGERNLIYAITGRKINSTMLPADVGCIVNNVDTAVSIYMAVCETTPLIQKIVTVTGDAVAHPQNYRVRIGTNYREILEASGGLKTKAEKIISGGPLMGNAIFSLDIPVTKTSSALLCMTEDEVALHEPSACIRCGRCVNVCPSNLIPQKLMEFAERYEPDGFLKLDGLECTECGSCTYICPAKRRLTQAFRQVRAVKRPDKK